MKKLIFIAVAAIMLCSCSTYKLSNTVWYNVTEGELGNKEANIITSLYFFEDNQMCFNTCIEQDTAIIVKPITVAYGEYEYQGNIKKGIKVNIKSTDLDGIEQTHSGIITKEGMLLSVSDSIARTFVKIKNVTLK